MPEGEKWCCTLFSLGREHHRNCLSKGRKQAAEEVASGLLDRWATRTSGAGREQAHDEWCVGRHDEAGKCLNVYLPGREQTNNGYTPHSDLTPELTEILSSAVDNLNVCMRDHPEDERLGRVEANLRWLLGKRI